MPLSNTKYKLFKAYRSEHLPELSCMNLCWDIHFHKIMMFIFKTVFNALVVFLKRRRNIKRKVILG